MPMGDGTGPFGTGCMHRRSGGYRRGFHSEVGYGRRYQSSLTKEEKKRILEEEMKDIELEKQAVERELKNLDKDGENAKA